MMQVVGLDLRLLRPAEWQAAAAVGLAPSESRSLRSQPDRHRAAWTAGRLALKVAAGSYACKPWPRVETGHLATGQPCVVGGTGPHCSLSHSGPLAVAAATGSPVGADVERIRPRDRALLDRVADRGEWEALGTGGDPDERLTTLWTIKEAALKWGGWGLSIPLRSARVVCRSGPGRLVVRVRWQEVDEEITVRTTSVRGFSLSIASNEPIPQRSVRVRWDPPLRLPAG